MFYLLAFIPASCSWLSLVERWFREITDKRIRHGTFQNVAALTAGIRNYIDTHTKSHSLANFVGIVVGFLNV